MTFDKSLDPKQSMESLQFDVFMCMEELFEVDIDFPFPMPPEINAMEPEELLDCWRVTLEHWLALPVSLQQQIRLPFSPDSQMAKALLQYKSPKPWKPLVFEGNWEPC